MQISVRPCHTLQLFSGLAINRMTRSESTTPLANQFIRKMNERRKAAVAQAKVFKATRLAFVLFLILVYLSYSKVREFQDVITENDAQDTSQPKNHTCVPSQTCYITQRGSDGFGHQLDGKLSMIATAKAFKNDINITYVHTNFFKFQHTNEPPELYDDFLNFSHLFPNFKDLERRFEEVLLVEKPIPEIVEELKSGRLKCCQNVVYWNDNAFNPMEMKSQKLAVYTDLVQNSQLFRNLRDSYHASQKPPIYLDPSRPNVAIHIRRGDAYTTRRVFGVKYFELAIDYVLDHYRKLGESRRPIFLVETDEPEWEGIKLLKRKYGDNYFRLGSHGSETVRRAFHTMVMADSFITSLSSLSKAAYIMRSPSKLTVACIDTDNGDRFRYPSTTVVYVCNKSSVEEFKEPAGVP